MVNPKVDGGGFTNKLLNVAVDTYPLVDELPSGGLVANILTPPPTVLITANVPSTFPSESTDWISKSSRVVITLSSKVETTDIPLANKIFAVPTTSFKFSPAISNDPPSETNKADAISVSPASCETSIVRSEWKLQIVSLNETDIFGEKSIQDM